MSKSKPGKGRSGVASKPLRFSSTPQSSRPLVSVLLPSYNHEAYVAEAIASVVNQGYRPIELVILDDGSTDNSYSIIEKLAARHSFIRFDRQPNAGVSVTSNRLMALARGEYFALLASDDVFAPSKLAEQVEVLERNRDVGAVFTHTVMVDAQGKVDRKSTEKVVFNHPRTREDLMRDLAFQNVLCAPSCMMRRSVYETIGDFAPDLVYTQDYDYWLRLVGRFELRIIEKPLIRYRWHGRNLSAIDEKSAADETWKTIVRHLDTLFATQPSLYVHLDEIAANLGRLAYIGGSFEDTIRFLQPTLAVYDLGLDNHFRLLGAYLNSYRFEDAANWARTIGRMRGLNDEMRATVSRTLNAFGHRNRAT